MNISISKQKFPLWSGANGSVKIDVQALLPNAPIPPGDTALFNANFSVDGSTPIALTQNGSLKLGVKAGASAKLAALFQNHTGAAPELVQQYALGNSLTADNLLLAFQLGGNADLSAAASFQYAAVTLGATLDTGVNAGLVAVRPFPNNENLGPMLEEFFANMRLPSDITAAPQPGEVIAIEYDGYLQLGASVSAGYELKGTKSFSIADLALSEHYDLSVLGKLAVTGRVAGQYSIAVRAGSKPGWANVKVHRAKSKSVQIAADASLNASLKMDGLPTSSKEFLGAILGVQAKNWLNLVTSAIDDSGQITTLDALKGKLDSLANDFVAKWLGKGIDQITSVPEVKDALAKINQVVTSYKNLDNSAISLFDRYFDPLASQIGQLTAKLNFLKGLQSWGGLPSEVDAVLWNVLRQLTAGDPLGAILGGDPSLKSVKDLVDKALSLIQDDAHAEIRKVIQIAKANFPLDGLLNQLDSVDTPDKLKAQVDTVAAHFVSRLIGKVIDKTLTDAQFKQIAKTVQQVKAAKDTIFNKLQQVLEAAAQQSLSVKLHAEYNAASTTDALIDCDLNLAAHSGTELMQAAGRGDFTAILSQYQPDVVQINAGRLTHNFTRSSAVSVNVVGWHFNFNYSAMDKLITNTDQQFKTADDGSLLISTDTSLSLESSQDRNKATPHEQSIRTNFLLRYLGQTRQVINDKKFDEATKTYLVDVVTGRSAVYTLNLTDASTTPQELADLFSFAGQIGLDRAGASTAAILPLLQQKDGNFGKVSAEYEVRYTEEGLENFLTGPSPLPEVNRLLKAIVLASYTASSVFLHDVAVAFCSPQAARDFQQNAAPFLNPGPGTEMSFDDIPAAPIAGMTMPGSVALTQTFELIELGHLFQVLLSTVQAVQDLRDALSGPAMPAATFEQKLQNFGKALQAFQGTSLSQNAVFAVFDHLVQLATPAPRARASAMQVTFTRDGAEKTVVFTLAAETGAALPAGI